MAQLNIKSPEAYRLASELARLTGESLTLAITRAPERRRRRRRASTSAQQSVDVTIEVEVKVEVAAETEWAQTVAVAGK